MNIALDTSALVISKKRGIGNYAIGLYNELFRIDHENQYYLLIWEEQREFEELQCGDNVHKYYTNALFSEMDSEEVYGQIIENFLKREMIDVFYFPNALCVKLPMIKKKWFGKTKVVATIHDIIPWMMKEKYFTTERERIKYYSYCVNLKEYDLLFANSEKTKNDVNNHFETKKITNISMSSHDNVKEKLFSNQEWEALKGKIGLGSDYILNVGGFSWNKNYPRLVYAYSKFVNECNGNLQMVLTGNVPTNMRENINFYLKCKNLEDKVILPGIVSDEELEMLYFNAYWVVFPSLYEGFGMPVIEAWQHNIPVMTSETTSLGEISLGAAIQVNPHDIESMKEGLCRIQKATKSERDEYIHLGTEKLKDFSWNKTAKLWLEEIKRICG